MSKPILSAFADEYQRDFNGQLDGLNKFGIDFIELRFINAANIADLGDEEVKSIKKKLNDKGIRVSAIGSPLGKIKTTDDMDAEMKKAERVFKTAVELDAKNIRMFSFYLDEALDAKKNRDIVYSSLERMVKLASKYGVTLCHENEAKIYGESPEACREILDYFGGELKCVFDMGNFTLEGYKPYPEAYTLLRDYIEYFHIKDSFATGAIVPPGCGEARIADIIKAHSEYSNRDFFISLEPHLQTFEGLNSIAAVEFDNPYKYETRELAFADAVEKIRAII